MKRLFLLPFLLCFSLIGCNNRDAIAVDGEDVPKKRFIMPCLRSALNLIR